MPAKASLFNQKAELVFDYGSGPKAGGTFCASLFVMENISRGPTFGDFITIRIERSMQDAGFRIVAGSGFNRVSGSGSGFGSRKAKMTHKSRKIF